MTLTAQRQGFFKTCIFPGGHRQGWLARCHFFFDFFKGPDFLRELLDALVSYNRFISNLDESKSYWIYNGIMYIHVCFVKMMKWVCIYAKIAFHANTST